MARLRARPHAKFDIMARSSPGKWPNRRHLMSTHRPARTTAQRRAHRRPKPTVERLSRAARSSVTVPCSSTATLQDAWWSFMMALQPADAPAPAVCSLVALEGHDGRERSSGLSATRCAGTLCERHGEIFQISRRPKGQQPGCVIMRDYRSLHACAHATPQGAAFAASRVERLSETTRAKAPPPLAPRACSAPLQGG